MSKLGTQKGQHIADLTEDEARAYLEAIIWPDGPVCPHCASRNVYKMQGKTIRDGLHRCRECKKQLTVTIGTIFEDSHIPLRKWVRAFHLMCSSKKGISALQLQRNLGLGSYKTAWFMCHRIRLAMKCGGFDTNKMKGHIEADDTVIGGLQRMRRVNGARDFSKLKKNKTIVLSLVERDGRKMSIVQGTVGKMKLREAMDRFVDRSATIHTDDAMANKLSLKGWKHHTVNHTKKEYARKEKDGTLATTNTVECSFALLKRGIVGIFHHISKKHLHRYCAEFDFRWNHRTIGDVERTREALKTSHGKRLIYRDTKRAA